MRASPLEWHPTGRQGEHEEKSDAPPTLVQGTGDEIELDFFQAINFVVSFSVSRKAVLGQYVRERWEFGDFQPHGKA